MRILIAFALLVFAHPASADPSTREDRTALFDYIINATMERTAFSPFKPLDFGAAANATEAEVVRASLLELREEFLSADTDEKLYFALVKLNATRLDSHLHVELVEGGINPFPNQVPEELQAPIKFKPDYSDKRKMFLFVSDFARTGRDFDGRTLEIGDKLIRVNGELADVYLARLAKFIGRSSHRALWWVLAAKVAQYAPMQIAPTMYAGRRVTYELQSRSGINYRIVLPYLKYDTIDWAGHDDHYVGGDLTRRIHANPQFIEKTEQVQISRARYGGAEHVFSRPAFDLYALPKRKVLLLQGHSFFPPTIVSDLDALLEHARVQKRLDWAIIYDLTRGSGGDFEEYTLQKLQSRPFKIMFGNLRVSDITPQLVRQIRAETLAEIKRGGPTSTLGLASEVASPNNGSFVLEWLDRDVAAAIASGQSYTNDVQFKNQFLPVSSDGFLYPAKTHFNGPMVLLTSPQYCSGADQFASMFIDNDLGLSVGMPQGGCSNTWEWTEVLRFPISRKSVATFAWTAGHSIRPNGQILEGNSALPRIQVPLTRVNYLDYYNILMSHALDYIEARRNAGVSEPSKLDRVTHERVNVGKRK